MHQLSGIWECYVGRLMQTIVLACQVVNRNPTGSLVRYGKKEIDGAVNQKDLNQRLQTYPETVYICQ